MWRYFGIVLALWFVLCWILDWTGRIQKAKEILESRGTLMAALGAFLRWRWSSVIIFAGLVLAFPVITERQTTVSSYPSEPEPPSEGPTQSTPRRAPETVNSSPPRFSEKIEKVYISIGERNFVVMPNVNGAHQVLLGVSSRGGVGLGGRGFANPTVGAKTSAFEGGATIPAIAHIENGELFIDAEVFAGVGQPPMHVRHNELTDGPANWDKNTDKNALEIVNENQQPVLQIIYTGEGRATVKGVFVSGDFAIVADQRLVRISKQRFADFPIKRLFKYPSWKYPGVFEETKD
jgi:hypothetical protein